MVAIFVASTAVTIANMFGQVRLNEWNGQFFDAVGRKDLSGFVHDLWTFLVIIAVLLALTVANTFLQERLKFRLREWITRHLLVEWLKPLRVYQLSFAGQYGHNPDQRIQEDTRLLGDYTADLGCGIVYSLLQIVAFVGVLWALSAQVTFQVAGYDIAIPGYMVWCALAYALIGSSLTWLVGRPLIALNGERYAREAEFRFALVRVNESGESIALHGGEKDEQRHLEAALAAVVDTMRRISSSLAHLTWITSGTGWLSLVVPILVAAPAYFGGSLTPRRPDHGGGRLHPGAGGDAMVRRQLFAARRLACSGPPGRALSRSARQPACDRAGRRGNQTRAPPGRTSRFRGRAHPLAGRTHRYRGRDRQHRAGRARADRRRHRKRKIDTVPRRGGSLAVGFRDNPHASARGHGIPAAAPLSAARHVAQRPELSEPARRLPRCGCATGTRAVRSRRSHPQARQTERWDKELSLGEQERLAFARLLLHKPGWVFLDEATAALDEDSQRRVMGLFDDELKNTTVLSIGHRPDLAVYHTRTLQLVHGRDGDRLKLKPPPAPPPPRRWLQRLDDWLRTVRS